MTRKSKFEYFHNHGDEDGSNSLTICFGDYDDLDSIIVSCEDTEEDAIEAVKRLNEILDTYAAQQVEEYKERLKAKVDAQSHMLLVTKDTFKEIIDEV